MVYLFIYIILYSSQNNISTIPDDFFQNLPFLNTLDLSNNKIKEIKGIENCRYLYVFINTFYNIYSHLFSQTTDLLNFQII